MQAPDHTAKNPAPGSLKEVAGLFLRLGFTAFGGPAAHIALMQREVVQKRNWINAQDFLDLLGATNLIPGPNSTEMAIHLGYIRAGWKGLIAAGLCFILPAVLLTAVLAWFYGQYGHLPAVQPFLYGITPAIVAVVLGAIYPLARQSLKSVELALLGLLVLGLSLAGIPEIPLLFGAGFVFLALRFLRQQKGTASFFPVSLLLVPHTLVQVSQAKLFWIFFKTGALLYGSGYVLFAFLDTELVKTGIMNRQVLTDAIAVGQFTPGPVFSSVTFIGYQLDGWTGAALCTTAIFLPGFVFVALLNPLVKKIRQQPLLGAFLDAVNMASVALILSVCYGMVQNSFTGWRSVVIALAALAVVSAYRHINSAWIVLGGSLAGYLLWWI